MNTYILTITDTKQRLFTSHVCITAQSKEDAKDTFEQDYNGYEVEVRTLPYDGSAMETVFAPSQRAAERIATGRKGEYSDVPEYVYDLDIDVTVQNVQTPENVDDRTVDKAKHAHTIITRLNTRNSA